MSSAESPALTSEVGILAVLSNGGRVMLPPLPQATAETTMTEERKHAILLAATILWARPIQEGMTSSRMDKAIDEAAYIPSASMQWPKE